VAEGARLESVFTGNRNVGSNPTPSARTLNRPHSLSFANLQKAPVTTTLSARSPRYCLAPSLQFRRSGVDAEPVGFELGVDGREQNIAVINRLSDRRIQTLGPGKHPDGNGLYLRVDENSRYWLFRYKRRGTRKERWSDLGRTRPCRWPPPARRPDNAASSCWRESTPRTSVTVCGHPRR
jgi:hypothetical protein